MLLLCQIMIQHETFDMRMKIRWQLLEKNFRLDTGTGGENLETLLHMHSIVTLPGELEWLFWLL